MSVKPIAVCKVVTDPHPGEETAPFATGFYDGKVKHIYWGSHCVDSLVKAIKKQEKPSIVYARDGGRKDFYYLFAMIDRRQISVIDSRIIRCYLGSHQLRDSWCVTPFDLYKHDETDYSTYHKDERESHRGEIQEQLNRVLGDEYALCSRFNELFGQYSTLGAASARELSRHCPFWRGKESYDNELRSRFYFGARNEIFRSGVISGDIHEYDVSSMYPSVMVNYLHPVGTNFCVGKRVTKRTCFVVVEGESHGAFCVRNADTRELTFSGHSGKFGVSIHEFHAGVNTGSFRVRKVLETYDWERCDSFGGFIDPMFAKRQTCRSSGDYWGDEIYKGIMVASYGKFGQNPSRYSDYFLTNRGDRPAAKGQWVIAVRSDAYGGYVLWKKPASHPVWMNVATAASITGAARAKLLEGISATQSPLYCDTDSIICDGPSKVKVGTGMGEWKLEHRASKAAMVRKKVYALFDRKGQCQKMAHSGCELTSDEILRAAGGEPIEKIDPRPRFHINGQVEFTKHTVKRVR